MMAVSTGADVRIRSYTARWTGPTGGAPATSSARSMACGSPSGSITVHVDLVKGAAIDVGPNEWLRSSPTLSPKLPVSPANVITTTGRLPFQTLIIWPRLCASPAPRWTDMTAVSMFACAKPPAIAATVPSCRDMIPWMSG